MNKADIKKAYKANSTLKKSLFQIEGVECLKGCYVKRFKAYEMTEMQDLTQNFEKKYKDGKNDARAIILEIFDEKGSRVFDYDDAEDVQFFSEMYVNDRNLIAEASRKANGVQGNA